MSQVGASVSSFTIADFTAGDTPRASEVTEAPPPSTALAVWTPPPEPGRWERLTWRVLGRPEPGQDGRFDHILVDASLITVPREPVLASLVLDLAKRGELSVKSFYDALALGTATTAKPKALERVRKSLRIAAEKLDARSPGAKLADAARGRLDIMRRELDALDALRTQPHTLAQRAEGGAASLLAAFDGHQADLTALLVGAATATGADRDAVEVVRAGLAGLAKRRDAVQTSLRLQLVEIRSACQERDAAAASAAARERVAAREAARAEEARVAAITNLSAPERKTIIECLSLVERKGARFYSPGGAAIRSRDVLSHLAVSGVDFALGPAPTLRSMLSELVGYTWTPKERQSVRDLSSLNALLERLAA